MTANESFALVLTIGLLVGGIGIGILELVRAARRKLK